jgi:hypothetical protein
MLTVRALFSTSSSSGAFGGWALAEAGAAVDFALLVEAALALLALLFVLVWASPQAARPTTESHAIVGSQGLRRSGAEVFMAGTLAHVANVANANFAPP